MSNKDLIASAFSAKDKKKLWIPEYIAEMQDISERKVISWVHKSGHLGYAILRQGNKLSGIILSCSPLTSRSKTCMCDWCFSVYNKSKIASVSYRKTPSLVIGHLICNDLNCEKRILSPDTNTVHSMRETLSKEARIDRYYENVEKYWEEHVSK